MLIDEPNNRIIIVHKGNSVMIELNRFFKLGTTVDNSEIVDNDLEMYIILEFLANPMNPDKRE